jgi:hypothetical protein
MKLKRIILSLGFVPLLCVPALGAIVGIRIADPLVHHRRLRME